MLLVVLTVAGGLIAGRLRGGRVRSLAGVGVRGLVLLAAGLGAQVAGELAGGVVLTVCLAALVLLTLVFLARNRHLAGTGLIACGLLANAAVLAANGAMPVSADAAARAGVPAASVAGSGHVLAGADTSLRVLSDQIPLPLPGSAQVLSPGDVLVVAGIGCLVAGAMICRPERRDGGSPRPT